MAHAKEPLILTHRNFLTYCSYSDFLVRKPLMIRPFCCMRQWPWYCLSAIARRVPQFFVILPVRVRLPMHSDP